MCVCVLCLCVNVVWWDALQSIYSKSTLHWWRGRSAFKMILNCGCQCWFIDDEVFYIKASAGFIYWYTYTYSVVIFSFAYHRHIYRLETLRCWTVTSMEMSAVIKMHCLLYVIRAHQHTHTHILAVSGRQGALMQCDCSPLGLLSAPLAELCCMQKPRRGIPQSIGLASCVFAHFLSSFCFFL